MQINSNMFKLEKEAYSQVEDLIKKVAEEHNITDVDSVSIKLSKDEAILSFKTASSCEDDKDEKKKEEKKKDKDEK